MVPEILDGTDQLVAVKEMVRAHRRAHVVKGPGRGCSVSRNFVQYEVGGQVCERAKLAERIVDEVEGALSEQNVSTREFVEHRRKLKGLCAFALSDLPTDVDHGRHIGDEPRQGFGIRQIFL